MRRLEQGARLHCLRRRRRAAEGAEAGDWEGREGERLGRPLQPEHEPDAGGAPGRDPGGHMEREPPEADQQRPARPDYRVDALQRLMVRYDKECT